MSWGLAVVHGRSMEPTLREGDRLLVMYGASVRPGDLAVVRLPDRPLSVKRVERREGDGWWIARDNPHEGVDSWQVGAVPAADVVARAVGCVWPLERVIPVWRSVRAGRRRSDDG